MEHPYYPISQVISVLNEKGFNEAALDLPSKPGMIENTIRLGYASMVKNASPNSQLENLYVEVPGQFHKRSDYVTFLFNFLYNHETDKMRIRAVNAVMPDADAKKLYIVGDTLNLTPAKEMYQDLAGIRLGKPLNILSNISEKPIIHQKKAHHL